MVSTYEDPRETVQLLDTCLCGIAVLIDKDIDGSPTCEWALVLSPTNYDAPNVQILRIVKNRQTALWSTRQSQGTLRHRGRSVVLHLATIQCPIKEVRSRIRLCPDRNGWDTHERMWCSANWVLRAIEDMVKEHFMPQPACLLVDLYDKVILNAIRMPASDGMQVVNNDGWISASPPAYVSCFGE
ncbi:hypothetical protein FIBSPDRAFT_1039219 [Athelia psychrophila]|uniref:Uncharacterized protein n=1 Tax=Athelia psychrophila TaxID=1759441 RepID=A0A166S054_9AGAM|nr:hypothetical protein FIBSPDRAFT_1039219 [Fibularhizoctonia sp. CBS 109695]